MLTPATIRVPDDDDISSGLNQICGHLMHLLDAEMVVIRSSAVEGDICAAETSDAKSTARIRAELTRVLDDPTHLPLRRDLCGRDVLCAPVQHGLQSVALVAIAMPPGQSIPIGPVWDSAIALVAISLGQMVRRQQLEAELTMSGDHITTLARKCQTDPLTQLDNRAAFQERCIARLTNDRRPAAMLAFDLDDFKQVNDIYGHLFGDTYLQEIAQALSMTLPKDSIIGRTGGDEFCALIEMPESGTLYLNSILRQTRHAIQRAMATMGHPDLGGISIGVSRFPTQANSYKGLHNLADCALYAAKRAGRDTTMWYSNDLDGLIAPANLRGQPQTQQLDRLVAQFQPIIDIATGTRVGVEILARLRNDKGDLCLPDTFEWMFRDHRYASAVTCHVLDSALEQLCIIDQYAPRALPDLWVNVTDSDFLNTDFVFDFQNVLERYHVDWHKVVIEVNEDTMVGARHGLVLHALKEISRRGGRIALDDFGAGQTGLTHSCQWPVDIIKLDQSLVQNLATDHSAVVAVEAIKLVTERLGQTLLAEGVETRDHMTMAHRLGCTLAQGYYFGQPMGSLDAGLACDPLVGAPALVTTTPDP